MDKTLSQRDRGLLDAAGLSIPETVALFQRSRQAIYQGLSNNRHYFTPQDCAMILNDAKRKDLSNLEILVKYIELNFDGDECGLILFDRIGVSQIQTVLSHAEAVLFIFNGNIDHLGSSASFKEALRQALADLPDLTAVIEPGAWVASFIQDNMGLPAGQVTSSVEEAAYLPPFVIVYRQRSARAFLFGRQAPEELPELDAKKLWEHFMPKCGQSFRGKLGRAV
ncbi:hypothetical protein LJR245_002235 [Rhizobium leguminosarum]|uniref:hypothetical protein n=1 Tax=Rhizobium leguminosarum TaxID=384 RepID=UPI003ECFF678